MQAAGRRGRGRKGPGRTKHDGDRAGEAQGRRAHFGPAEAGPACDCTGDRRTDVVVGEARVGVGPARDVWEKPGGVCDRRVAGVVDRGVEAGGCAAVVFKDDVSASVDAAYFGGAGLSWVSDC